MSIADLKKSQRSQQTPSSGPSIDFKVPFTPFKRLFDLLFSLMMLLLLSPLFFAIAVSIRITSRGSPLYVQPRLGKGGKVFKCYKFRTMYLDAEKRLDTLLSHNPHLQREWQKKQKLKHDPRIFPLGKWLRQTSLDELPQFWNVVKGDLSVVGPRPYMIFQKEFLGSLSDKILSIRPGITGLWQTSGRSRTTFQQRVALDAAYVDKSSFWYDLYLIVKTLFQLLFQNDAF